MMNQRVKELWCKALRSKRYRQCYGRLHGGKNFRCAAGVLVECYIYTTAAKNNNACWIKQMFLSNCEDHEVLTLPQEVQKWSGLPSTNPKIANYGTLQDLNDLHKATFDKIADIIEQNL